jgi:hypothetical protein
MSKRFANAYRDAYGTIDYDGRPDKCGNCSCPTLKEAYFRDVNEGDQELVWACTESFCGYSATKWGHENT